MRHIIFRGKRLDNGEWVYGDLIENQGRYFIYHAMSETTIEDNDDGRIVVAAVKVDPDTVGQYTGMKDKNGKKIFEGDIMSLVTEFGDTIIREIRFIDGAFCVIGEQEDDLHGLSWAVEMCDGIVGDNIHDNPDLLK
jgi:uncharacterized phage protein (TIGR01671 family)